MINFFFNISIIKNQNLIINHKKKYHSISYKILLKFFTFFKV